MSDSSPQQEPEPNAIPTAESVTNEIADTAAGAFSVEQPPNASLNPGDSDSSEITDPVQAEAQQADSEVTVAEAIEPLEATVVESSLTGLAMKKAFSEFQVKTPPPIPSQFENLAASGGAVTAAVLGMMTLVGAWFSAIAAINGVLGVGMGLWGLASRHKRTAQVGIFLCILGIVLAIYRQP